MRTDALRSAPLAFVLVVLAAACGGAPEPGEAQVFAHALNVATGQLDGDMTQLAAQESRAINPGDAIHVDGSGEAHLHFSDFITVKLFRDSDIRAEAFAHPDAPPWAELQLLGGTILADVEFDQLAEQRVSVTTEAAVVRAVGTQFLVHETPVTDVTWVVVTEGIVEVTGAGVTVSVGPGFATSVEPGQAPAAPFPATREEIGTGMPDTSVLTREAYDDGDLLRGGTGSDEPAPEPETEAPSEPETEAPSEPETEAPSEPEPDVTLSVSVIGRGTVAADGISCGEDCMETYSSGSTVTLTADPAEDWEFAGWSVGCPEAQTGAGELVCTLTVKEDVDVGATFDPPVEPAGATVTVVVRGEADVTVDGVASGPGDVRAQTVDGVVTIGVTPQEGWRFVGYRGYPGCDDSPQCKVATDEDITITAVLEEEETQVPISPG